MRHFLSGKLGQPKLPLSRGMLAGALGRPLVGGAGAAYRLPTADHPTVASTIDLATIARHAHPNLAAAARAEKEPSQVTVTNVTDTPFSSMCAPRTVPNARARSSERLLRRARRSFSSPGNPLPISAVAAAGGGGSRRVATGSGGSSERSRRTRATVASRSSSRVRSGSAASKAGRWASFRSMDTASGPPRDSRKFSRPRSRSIRSCRTAPTARLGSFSLRSARVASEHPSKSEEPFRRPSVLERRLRPCASHPRSGQPRGSERASRASRAGSRLRSAVRVLWRHLRRNARPKSSATRARVSHSWNFSSGHPRPKTSM